MFSMWKTKSNDDNNAHMVNEIVKAITVERCTSNANRNRKIMLIPNSAGTTAADRDAKSTSLLMAMKINAMTIVEGRVPRMPPVFVP